jgi:hypothetical protein
MKQFHVHATKSGTWWAVTIDEDPRAQTQARRLDKIEAAARSVLVDMNVLGPNEAARFTISIDADDLESLRNVAIGAKRTALNAAEQASEAARTFARRASEEGLPVRDIGALLGMSYQRAHQLLAQKGGA